MPLHQQAPQDRPLLRPGDYVHLRLPIAEDHGDEFAVWVVFASGRPTMAPLRLLVPACWCQVVGYEPGPWPARALRPTVPPNCLDRLAPLARLTVR